MLITAWIRRQCFSTKRIMSASRNCAYVSLLTDIGALWVRLFALPQPDLSLLYRLTNISLFGIGRNNILTVFCCLHDAVKTFLHQNLSASFRVCGLLISQLTEDIRNIKQQLCSLAFLNFRRASFLCIKDPQPSYNPNIS